MAKQEFYLRQFLNTEEHGGTALVEANVAAIREGTVDASFSIADCGRMISIDFGVYRGDSLENGLVKIRRLRLAIQQFEKALLDAYKQLER